MADHTQQTPEELQKQLDEAITTLEEPQANESSEIPDEEPVEEAAQSDDAQAPVEEADNVSNEAPQEEVEEAPKELPTTEERYKESTREAQRLYRNNAQINSAIKEANELPEPTEADLQAEYPEWDIMSDVEKRLSTETLINKRFRDHINQASLQQRSVDEWADKVEKFVDDPKTLIDFPDLEGKVEKFKAYAGDKKLVGTDYSVLIGGFLYKESREQVKHTGKMLETGQGGDKKPAKPIDDKISVADSAKLRDTDYNKYRELLKQGKIATALD